MAAGVLIWVADATGGATDGVSNGTGWRIMSNAAMVKEVMGDFGDLGYPQQRVNCALRLYHLWDDGGEWSL